MELKTEHITEWQRRESAATSTVAYDPPVTQDASPRMHLGVAGRAYANQGQPPAQMTPDNTTGTFTERILDAVAASIAVLDRNGVIVAVNESWRRFALEHVPQPGLPAPHAEVGSNYLKLCEDCEGPWCDGGHATCASIRAVLRGDRSDFTLEYPSPSPAGKRWFQMSARRLEACGHGVVITQTDITERREAQKQLENSQSQLRALAARLQAVREEERTRVAGAVHDDLGQMLTGLMLDLEWFGKRVARVGDAQLQREMADKITEIKVLARSMILTVREIASDMRPQALDNLGLGSAIRFEVDRFAKRSGIPCEVDVQADTSALPPETTTGLFRIFQEALTNVARHAQASRICVRLAPREGGLILVVQDDGQGIASDKMADIHSLGLLGMRERAAQLAAALVIDSRPGCGTTVTVTLP